MSDDATDDPGTADAPGSDPAIAGDGERSFVLFGAARRAPPLPGGLHVVATPIGHLEDVSLRVLATLAAADLIACEDTRVTRKLLARYGIARPLTAYHEHNAAQARPKILARLATGEAVALVSDAGTPLVSDPGFRLVREAREAGFAVTAVPGPSAVLTALTIAGLPTDRFFFEGFLPPRGGPRKSRIAEIAGIPATLVLFETGPRLADALADLAAGLGPREAAVCRELTKLHEEVRRGDLAELAAVYAAGAETRGEVVLVIGPPSADAHVSPAEIDDKLVAAMRTASLKDAVAAVAAATGEPRRTVYQRALALGREASDEP
ncbi:16S rRNA (cytidine(1402)-2'-O)-methyltransferase [Rhodoplanes sp. TEM]|uniref:Ribosomal RNA small subunit methyltransferase I n=1 Tax=Rhodoplanes tepidamans TaxID=200616 RepID=A0ABT5JE55_RHOTP|nr:MULTISPECIES: 16S rRNA (cytidine(1402)-2'-O)-methyltransferase [Rhodoplanes]MDC7787887.1 16S rRNA (cytidine(1402)-2'-O)-methyltransferase [Rhodoplanes tepidamans]MDC7987981.1 16S rRNA (cytidine(1402)-2'-O)-methyltransferase [Rhodoplanes sp. TEM]MDQ0353730.1 16S rRNA (cytidine1402-2'-O)-methyltransferase [Rhodoplanes tepidamans]